MPATARPAPEDLRRAIDPILPGSGPDCPFGGGDEFVALLIDSPAEGLTEALNHLRQRLADEGGHDGPTYELRCSIGRAKYDPSGEPNLAALMAAADQQMYRDKAGRR